MFINDLSSSMFFSLKGEFKGECNRTVCGTKNAVFFNNSTQKYYCGSCAHAINYKEKICVPHKEENFLEMFSPSAKSLVADSNLKSGVFECNWNGNKIEIKLGLGITETIEVDKISKEPVEKLCYVEQSGKVNILDWKSNG